MIVKRFLEQVATRPAQVAISSGEESLSYRDLNASANRIANAIRNLSPPDCGRKPATWSLLFAPGANMIAALLAALKSGCAYVPLDINYPQNRLRFMLEHSESEVLVTDRGNLPYARELAHPIGRDLRIIAVDALEEVPATEPQRGDAAQQGRPAYILYTSGSTGWPKGVAQSQENILYFIEHWSRRIGIAETDRIVSFASLNHDASIPDIYGALLNGATLFPYDVRRRGGFQRLEEWLLQERITIWHSVPTWYRRFAESLEVGREFPHVRWVVLGGEGVREHDVLLFRQRFPQAQFANLYGQTESTINTVWALSPKDSFRDVIIGEPIGDTQVLLVDDEDRIVEGSGDGEIVIASNHVALGYWRDEEASKEAFTEDDELGRLYWTGDLGQRSINGGIRIIGRKDTQAKIRGHRVELGEIENILVRHAKVHNAVVIARPNIYGESDLRAYFTADQSVEPAELRELLSLRVPDYMLPRSFTPLTEMPLTPTGKIDRAKLAAQEGPGPPQALEAPPQTETQRTIAGIWRQLLGVDAVDIRANFFELGGHSILMISMLSMFHSQFGVELKLQDLFRYQTIE